MERLQKLLVKNKELLSWDTHNDRKHYSWEGCKLDILRSLIHTYPLSPEDVRKEVINYVRLFIDNDIDYALCIPMSDSGKYYILVSKKLDYYEQARCFLHELCHVYYNVQCMTPFLKGAEELSMENLLTAEAYRFIRKHPEFTDEIMKELDLFNFNKKRSRFQLKMDYFLKSNKIRV